MRVVCDDCGAEIDITEMVTLEISYSYKHFRDDGVLQDYKKCLCMKCGKDIRSAVKNILREKDEVPSG